MARGLDRGSGVQAAALALEPGAAPIRPTEIKARQARPAESLYRVRSSHLYMANRFKEGPGTAYRGEVQKVLQTLRWDPIDGSLVAIASGDRAGSDASNGVGAAVVGRFGLGPEVVTWLRERGLGQDLRRGAGPGLSLLELCSCIALGPRPSDGVRAALDARRTRGDPRVYAGSARFFWRKSYHLALPDGIGLGGHLDPADGWHAEGGQYEAGAPMFGGPVWRRRARRPAAGGTGRRDAETENARPADSFDPRPAYRFGGLDEATADRLGPELPHPGAAQEIRFEPFVLRVGDLDPWPPNPLLRAPAEAGRPRLRDNRDRSGLAAWYRPCPGIVTMRWLVSPRLEE